VAAVENGRPGTDARDGGFASPLLASPYLLDGESEPAADAIRDLSTLIVRLRGDDRTVAAAVRALAGRARLGRQLGFTLDGALVCVHRACTLSVRIGLSDAALEVLSCAPALTGVKRYGRVVAGRTNVVVQAGGGEEAGLVSPSLPSPRPASPASPWKRGGDTRPASSPGTALGSPLARPLPSPLPASPAPRVAPLRPFAAEPALTAGLEGPLAALRELVLLPATHPTLSAALHLRPPRGILLHGPPGVGKTLLVRTLVQESARLPPSYTPVHVSSVDSALLSPMPGEAEASLRALFEDAARAAAASPLRLALVFIDEIDALAPRREAAGGRVGGATDTSTGRLLTQLLTLMDGASGGGAEGSVVVLAATNRPEALDPAIRRPGRLDREVRIDHPSATARAAILALHAASLPALALDVTPAALGELAESAVGFVGADLAALVYEAGVAAASRGAQDDVVCWADFMAARARVSASSLRGARPVLSATTNWEDVGGMDGVIARLRSAVEAPFTHAALFGTMGLAPPRGVLLHGPPGNSKTTLVRALACSVRASFFSLTAADILSAYVGDAEAALRSVFERARRATPALIFLDEVDALVGRRGQGATDATGGLLTTLLTEMDGVVSCDGILVVAATNRMGALDPALLRPGRLELHLHVPAPDALGRAAILRIHTRRMPLGPCVDLDEQAAEICTGGWSGAELEGLAREAAMGALRESVQEGRPGALLVLRRHFQDARCALGGPKTRTPV
jgi:transitional endoplasmic reticulum ATPase